MTTIKISKNIELHLTFEPQMSPSGRLIRLSGISKNLQKPQFYINNMYRSCWIYTFKYLDAYDEFVSFEFDYNDNFIGKVCI